MSSLKQEDCQCFICNLSDCKERHPSCKRKRLIEEREERKVKLQIHKMTSQYKQPSNINDR